MADVNIALSMLLYAKEIGEVALVAGKGVVSSAGFFAKGFRAVDDEVLGAEGVPIKMHGSGPASGIISVFPKVKSVKALENYFPNTLDNAGIEYVYDPERNIFAVGKVNNASELGITGSPHQQLVRAIKANEETVLGGTFLRGEKGEIILTENSGHYGLRWNNFPGAKEQLSQMLNERLNVKIVLERWNELNGGMKNGI